MSDTPLYWLYILACDNGTYYTGYTVNLLRRYQEHRSGSPKCKYTRSFKPLQLEQCWALVETKGTVLKLEKFIKTLSRAQKQRLISHPEKLREWYKQKNLVVAIK